MKTKILTAQESSSAKITPRKCRVERLAKWSQSEERKLPNRPSDRRTRAAMSSPRVVKGTPSKTAVTFVGRLNNTNSTDASAASLLTVQIYA